MIRKVFFMKFLSKNYLLENDIKLNNAYMRNIGGKNFFLYNDPVSDDTRITRAYLGESLLINVYQFNFVTCHKL